MFGDLLGKNLNRYRIEKQIGAGGMGVVFLAHEARLALGKAEMQHGHKRVIPSADRAALAR